MNNRIHVSLSILVSSGYMPRSEITGSYGGFILSFLMNLHTISHSGCINLHSHQKCKSIPFSPHPLQQLLFVDFFDDCHSDRCEVISHCSFDLHFSNNERCWASFHVFVSHLYWRNVYLGLFPTFRLGCLFFWYWVVWAACIFWKLILCQLLHLLLFSPILEGCLFTLFIVSFAVYLLLSLTRSHLFTFVFISIILGDGS